MVEPQDEKASTKLLSAQQIFNEEMQKGAEALPAEMLASAKS